MYIESYLLNNGDEMFSYDGMNFYIRKPDGDTKRIKSEDLQKYWNDIAHTI